MIINEMEKSLAKRHDKGNFRSLKVCGKLIDFASNDYLGLSRSQILRQRVLKEWENGCQETHLNGLGSTGSRLLTGNSLYAEQLENKIAAYHGYEAGLLFSCGYMANVGLLASIASNSDLIIYDADVHASTHDGIRMSQAKRYPFRHNDLDHLEKRLSIPIKSGQKYVCVESVYSIDGSIAPLVEISHLCEKYQANLIVDEAHAFGIFGPGGSGLVGEKNLMKSVFAQVTTFGKALGTYGAVVLGNRVLKEYLINFSRSVIYTTFLPQHNLAAIKCAYDLLPGLERERFQLRKLINYFCSIYPNGTATPVQPLYIPGNMQVKQISQKLAQKGFDVRAILSPTVKRGEECLRICLHSFNTESEVKELLQTVSSNFSRSRC